MKTQKELEACFDEMLYVKSSYDNFLSIARDCPTHKCLSVIYKKVLAAINNAQCKIHTIKQEIKSYSWLKGILKARRYNEDRKKVLLDLSRGLQEESNFLEEMLKVEKNLVSLNKGEFTEDQYQKEQNAYQSWKISYEIIVGMLAKNLNVDKRVIKDYMALSQKPSFYNGVNPIPKLLDAIEGSIEGKNIYAQVMPENVLKASMNKIKKDVSESKKQKEKLSAGMLKAQSEFFKGIEQATKIRINEFIQEQKDLHEKLQAACGHILVSEKDLE